MCYVLKPSDLLAYITTKKNNDVISFRNLKGIRESIEKESESIFVEITSRAVINAVDAYPEIYEMDDTKIIINKDKLNEDVKTELENSAENLPEQYKVILDKVIPDSYFAK